MEAWSDALRLELAGTGVKVSLIEPGPIHTAFTQNVEQTQKDKPVKNPGIASRFTLTPEHVVEKLIHALESSRPKVRYSVTLLTVAVRILKRILPDKIMDKILANQGKKLEKAKSAPFYYYCSQILLITNSKETSYVC